MSAGRAQHVALLGGSFDPPHLGHLAMARVARDLFALDKILLTPTGLQPFKRRGAEASFADRIAMTELLCAEEPEYLQVSTLDAPRTDAAPNYTVETLEAMRSTWPDARLFAIIGADSLGEFPRWHQAERLRELAEWIVVSRPGFPLAEDAITSGRLYRIQDVSVPLASRILRERLRRGESCADAMPTTVLRYIRAHGLYGTARSRPDVME